MELDVIDVRILERLLEDGRESFNDLARNIGVSTPTISARVHSLTQLGLIRGFRVDLDTEVLNEVSGMIILDCRPSDVDILADKMGAFEEVRELYVIDGSRLFAKVTSLDNAHMNAFFDGLSGIEEIASYRYHPVSRTVMERSRALIHRDLKVTVECYYCRKPIVENPVKIKLDGKDHYLCCGSCEKLYREKYDRLMEGADLSPVCTHEGVVGGSETGHDHPHEHSHH